MIWIIRICIAALLLYLAVAVTAYFAQRKILYFPPALYHPPPAEMVEIRTESGYLGWYSQAKDDRPTIMVFHGNASSIDSNMHIFRDLQATGFGVWSVGYPGYPGTAGKPTQENLIAAATEQYEHLSNMGVENIVFYGSSLGSGVASQLAANHPPQLLIVDAPFKSVADIARKQMPFLPTGLLLKDKWRSDQALKDLDVPLIWIHGTADTVIPISEGQRLFDGYGGPKTAYSLKGADHNNTWLNGGRDIVLNALENL